jgi:lysozyme family protein
MINFDVECRRRGMYSEAFCTAFCSTMQHEGGYADDPLDPGGMTYMGISRVNHPAWAGWQVIDDLRTRSTEPAYSLHVELQNMVRYFYHREFWIRMQGEYVASLSVDLAGELFDTAVNLGRRRAVEILQQALNLLNRDQLLYADIVEDGMLGNITRQTLARYCNRQDPAVLVKIMNHLQAGHYINLMRKYPSRERFVGWFSRT